MLINYKSFDSFLAKLDENIDYDELLKGLNKIATEIVELGKYDFKVYIVYVKHDSVLMSGNVNREEGRIGFNINRIKAILNLKLDPSDPNFKSFIDNFALDYENGKYKKTEENDALYFTVKNRPLEYVYILGSYKLIGLDLVMTVLHEIQHMVQHSFLMSDPSKKPLVQEEVYHSFAIFLNKLYYKYKYTDDNYYRPVELNAVTVSSYTLSKYMEKSKIKSSDIKNFTAILWASINQSASEYTNIIKNHFLDISKNKHSKEDRRWFNFFLKNWAYIEKGFEDEFEMLNSAANILKKLSV